MSHNNKLTQEIVRHIFANFGIIPSSHVNIDASKLLTDPLFLLPETLTFTGEFGDIVNKIYGCEVNIANQKSFKVLLGDCYEGGPSDGSKPYDYALIVHLKDAPIYGAFCSEGDVSWSEPLLALNIDGKGWSPCTTYLQATFLAGMEQLKEISLNWKKCTDYGNEFKALQSFIKFHDSLSEIT
jgi:hypothetical protein